MATTPVRVRVDVNSDRFQAMITRATEQLYRSIIRHRFWDSASWYSTEPKK